MKTLKKTLDDYRGGATGALVDEYERAAFELKAIVQGVGEDDYSRIADAETENEDCRSIQTIMSHVVRSGYGYSNYIRGLLSMKTLTVENKQIGFHEITGKIDQMLAATIEIYEEKRAMLSDDVMDNLTVVTRWGVTYNIEQILEHAIVHILRHRRQIDKFLMKFNR